MLYSAFLSLYLVKPLTPHISFEHHLWRLSPCPLSLFHPTSEQQLGVSEAINNYFPAHLPVLFWRLLNGKHTTYWHSLDHNVNKFNSVLLKDRLIQFSSAFLQAIESRIVTGRDALKTPSCIIIWISLGFWIVPLMKFIGGKKSNLICYRAAKKSCNSFWKIVLASCSANLVLVFMRTVSMHP